MMKVTADYCLLNLLSQGGDIQSLLVKRSRGNQVKGLIVESSVMGKLYHDVALMRAGRLERDSSGDTLSNHSNTSVFW